MSVNYRKVKELESTQKIFFSWRFVCLMSILVLAYLIARI